MTATAAASAAYIVVGLLFVLALAGLSKHEAKAGNGFGMVCALATTIGLATRITAIGHTLLIVAMMIGASIGLLRAAKVEMTGTPKLIAMLHSFVGLAAVLVGWNGYLSVEADGGARRRC
jgi:NAD(P) transhydrogenase subunit beta